MNRILKTGKQKGIQNISFLTWNIDVDNFCPLFVIIKEFPNGALYRKDILYISFVVFFIFIPKIFPDHFCENTRISWKEFKIKRSFFIKTNAKIAI